MDFQNIVICNLYENEIKKRELLDRFGEKFIVFPNVRYSNEIFLNWPNQRRIDLDKISGSEICLFAVDQLSEHDFYSLKSQIHEMVVNQGHSSPKTPSIFVLCKPLNDEHQDGYVIGLPMMTTPAELENEILEICDILKRSPSRKKRKVEFFKSKFKKTISSIPLKLVFQIVKEITAVAKGK